MFSNVLELFVNVFFLFHLLESSLLSNLVVIDQEADACLCLYEALALLMCIRRASCCFIKIGVITDVVVKDI